MRDFGTAAGSRSFSDTFNAPGLQISTIVAIIYGAIAGSLII